MLRASPTKDLNKQNSFNAVNNQKSLENLHGLFIKYKQHVVGSAPATIKSYQQTFKLLLQYKSDLKPNDLTEETIILFFEFLNTRLRKVGNQQVVRVYKNSSIASVRGKLGTFFNWLVERSYIPTSPFQKMEYPDVSYTDPRAFTAKEFDKICTAVNTKIQWANLFIKKRNITIIMLLAFTGLRKEELIGLQMNDVDMERKVITVRSSTTKSKRARTIPINNQLIPYLTDYLSYRYKYKTNAFWVSGTLDRPLTEHGVKHLANLITRVTNINCHWHRYRHTFAINFYNKTRDVLSLHRLMGHSSLKMTLTYLRSLPEDHFVNQVKRISIDEFV